MLVKTIKNKNTGKLVEVRQGLNGSGKVEYTTFKPHPKTPGRYDQETFKSLDAACCWAKFS